MSKAIIFPVVSYIPAAVTDGGAYLMQWSASTSKAPNDYYTTGTEVSHASVKYPSSSMRAMSTTFRLPDDTYLAAGVSVKICWASSATSGTCVWNVKSGFAATNTVMDPVAPTFNAAQAISATPCSSAAFGLIQSTLSSLTTTSGAAGSHLYVELLRPASSSDTMTADAIFFGAEVTYSRLVTLT